MIKYVPLNEGLKSKKIDGEFGKGGFLSELSVEELWKVYDLAYVMMEINMDLLDISDSGKGLSKALNKLTDMRVDDKEYHGKFSIKYPSGVWKNKKLLALYHKLTIKHLDNVKSY